MKCLAVVLQAFDFFQFLRLPVQLVCQLLYLWLLEYLDNHFDADVSPSYKMFLALCHDSCTTVDLISHFFSIP